MRAGSSLHAQPAPAQAYGIRQAQEVTGKAATGRAGAREQRLVEVVDRLWAMFDQAMARGNAAHWPRALAEPIAGEWHGRERRYRACGRDGRPRMVSIFLAMPQGDCELFGGAFVKASGVAAPIYLMPMLEDGTCEWMVQASGTPCSAATVDDLFLATFAGDAHAASRLLPLLGYDLFATAWS